MGANLSMDVSADIVPTTATATATATATTAGSSPLLLPMLTPTPEIHAPSSVQDKTRLDTLLIPEDLVDIHIEGSATTVVTAVDTEGTAVADNGGGGGNKCRKRHGRKKQNETATASAKPFQTERTIDQRREQVRPIIDKLTELQMNISYPAIRELYKQLNQFVKTGEDTKIKIPFPEFGRRIKGELTNAVYKPCWVKLEME
jgi:hypothetical protein